MVVAIIASQQDSPGFETTGYHPPRGVFLSSPVVDWWPVQGVHPLHDSFDGLQPNRDPEVDGGEKKERINHWSLYT